MNLFIVLLYECTRSVLVFGPPTRKTWNKPTGACSEALAGIWTALQQSSLRMNRPVGSAVQSSTKVTLHTFENISSQIPRITSWQSRIETRALTVRGVFAGAFETERVFGSRFSSFPSTPKCLSTLFSVQLRKLHVHVTLLLTHIYWPDPH